MPQVFRAMRKEKDALPMVAAAANALGVRPGIDVDLDAQKCVLVNRKGMSVSPSWRHMSVFRIPKRLGGQGGNITYCFSRGSGAFQRALFAPGLELFPDSPTHAVVRPLQPVALAQFEADLAATRAEWQIDET